jgi:hypothetical protein
VRHGISLPKPPTGEDKKMLIAKAAKASSYGKRLFLFAMEF